MLLEAMAAGLPVISTPVGAIPELIKPGTNGFLVPPGDYEALAEKILMLVKDEPLRKMIGKNNRAKVMQEYDFKIIANKLEVVYDKLSLISNRLQPVDT